MLKCDIRDDFETLQVSQMSFALMMARYFMTIFALPATCFAMLWLGSTPALGAQNAFVGELRRNGAAIYENIPLCIQQCTATINAAQQAGDEESVAIAQMQRSAALLRSKGFEECRPDFECAKQVRINPNEPELVLLYEIPRTIVEHTVYPQTKCLKRLQIAADAAAGAAHSDVLYAAQVELAVRSMKAQRVTSSIQYVPVLLATNTIAISRDSVQEQFLSVLRQPTMSNDMTADELNRGVFYRAEILNLPGSLKQTGAAPRFQYEASLLAATMLEQNGQLAASLKTLTAARKVMWDAGDLSAVALTDIRIGTVLHRLGQDVSARDALISAAENIQLITEPSTLTQLSSTVSQISSFSKPLPSHGKNLLAAVQMRFLEIQKQGRWIQGVTSEAEMLRAIRKRDDFLLISGIVIMVTIGLAVLLLRERRRLRKLNAQLHHEILAREKAAEERERLELYLAQSARLESLGDLAGGIAHDFNNLLVGVLGNAELMRYTENISERASEYLNGITTAAETAADLSRKMLAYAGKQKAKKTTVELNQLVQRMLPLFQSGAGVQHKMEFFPSTHPVYTEADEGQLEQILLNLVSNAAHAMSNRTGTIQIRVGFEFLEHIAVDTPLFGNRREGGDFAWFEITDEGNGIPEAHLTRIFEPFYTTKDQAQLHGFGLAVVYGHVNRHNGLIRLISAKDVGTTFRILLPRLSEFHTESLRVDGDLPSRVLPKFLTAVIVDDQLHVLQFVERLFQAHHWSAHCFLTATEALEFLSKRDSIDCLLIDLMMPGVSGISMLEELERRRSEIPVILMSGFSETNMHELLRFQSVSSLLEKPFRPKELVKAISAAVSRSIGQVTSTS